MHPDDAYDDDALWEAFHARALPASAWTHRAHLRMAFLYARRHSLDEAHVLLRVGIVRLNASHGLVETVARGYHETLTRAWLVLVAHAICESPSIDDSARFVDAHAERLSSSAPLRHYSRERIVSTEARARFVEPDLAPLPVAEGPPAAAVPRVGVVAADPEDWLRVKALRLAALADAPDAFGSTLDGERDQPERFWRARFERVGTVTLLATWLGDDGTRGDVGLAVVSPSSDDPAVAGLYSVWVAPGGRGRGVGDALIAAAVAHVSAARVPRIVLEVGDHNAPAIRLYRRAGFRPTGRRSALAPPRDHITEHEMALDLQR